MLFALEHKTEGTWHYLSSGLERYSIGRKNCNILINNDGSVSREHAAIKVTKHQAVLVDCKATYHTYHNNKALEPAGEVVLHDGDEIKCGASTTIFKFHAIKLQITGSRLDSNSNKKLKSFITELNGTVTNNWSNECTHLTVKELVLSIKVLEAVMDEKPVVNISYWETYVQNVKKNKMPPPAERYKPPMAEALLNSVSFDPDPKRRTLFKDKVFIFTTDAEKLKMGNIIAKAGGSSISWEESPLTIENFNEAPSKYIVIQNKDENSESLKKFICHYEKQGKRTIPIQEIAMSIVHCSCEKDCNPDFDRAKQVFKANKNADSVENITIAKSTESEFFPLSEKPSIVQVVVSETMDIDREVELPMPSNAGKTIKESEKQIVDELFANAGPSGAKNGSKRHDPGSSKENVQPAKKLKLSTEIEKNSAQPSGSKDTQTKNSGFIDTSRGSNKDKKEATPKRKADENLDDSSAKKGKGCINPFATLPTTSSGSKKSTGPDNPFATLKNKVNSAVTKAMNNNPFKKIISAPTSKQNESAMALSGDSDNTFLKPANAANPFQMAMGKGKNKGKANEKSNNSTQGGIFSSTTNERVPNNTLIDLDVSKIGSVTYSTMWLSKDKCKDVNGNVTKHVDPDIEKFCNSFINCVVIKRMASIVKKEVPECERTYDPDGRVKSFKKFKKVKPLRPQTTVISFGDLKQYNGDSKSDKNVVPIFDSDEETLPEPKKKLQKKRFNF